MCLAYHDESIWTTFGWLSAGLNLFPHANSVKLRSVGVNILQSFLQKVVEQQIPEGPKDIGTSLDQSGLVAPMLASKMQLAWALFAAMVFCFFNYYNSPFVFLFSF